MVLDKSQMLSCDKSDCFPAFASKYKKINVTIAKKYVFRQSMLHSSHLHVQAQLD